LNSRILNNGFRLNGKLTGLQPCFAASLRF
jgi:hypothetical protein